MRNEDSPFHQFTKGGGNANHPSQMQESYEANLCAPKVIYSSRVIHRGSPGSFNCKMFSENGTGCMLKSRTN